MVSRKPGIFIEKRAALANDLFEPQLKVLSIEIVDRIDSDEKVPSSRASLRNAVAELARGDNVVSRWIYEIEEKLPAPRDTRDLYPECVDAWIFGRSSWPQHRLLLETPIR